MFKPFTGEIRMGTGSQFNTNQSLYFAVEMVPGLQFLKGMKSTFYAAIFFFLSHSFASEPIPENLDAELSKEERTPFAQQLQNHSKKVLEAQKTPSCEASYQHIFSEDQVRISVMYGYLDADGGAVDGSLARALVDHLQLPCRPENSNVEACGFQAQKNSDGSYVLTRQIQIGKKTKQIVMDVFAPAVTWKDQANKDSQQYYFDQKARSDKVEKAFYESIQKAQVVFYNGHSSRLGNGPNFHPTTPVQLVWESMTKKSINKFLSNLQKSPELKFLGMFACDSEKLYEKQILSAAPDVGLIVSTEPVTMKLGNQSILGSLNSLLTRKCKSDFAKSTVPASEPEVDILRVKNFFEYSRSSNTKGVSSQKAAAAGAQ